MTSLFDPPFYDTLPNWLIRLQLVDYPVQQRVDHFNNRLGEHTITEIVMRGIVLARFISVPDREGYLLTHLYRTRLQFHTRDDQENRICSNVNTSQILDFDWDDREILLALKPGTPDEWALLHKRLVIALHKFSMRAHLSVIAAQIHGPVKLIHWKLLKDAYKYPMYAVRTLRRRESIKK